MATTVDGILQVTADSGEIVANISGQPVLISGSIVVTDISGQPVATSISGQSVTTSISGQPVSISGSLLSVQALESYTYWIEQGRYFRVDTFQQPISKPSAVEIVIRTSTAEVHMTYQATVVGGNASVQLIENPTVTSNGLTQTIYNFNRISGVETVTTAYTGGTTTSGSGTQLFQEYLPGTAQWAYMATDGGREFVLRTSSTYTLRTFARDTQLGIGVSMFWWEIP